MKMILKEKQTAVQFALWDASCGTDSRGESNTVTYSHIRFLFLNAQGHGTYGILIYSNFYIIFYPYDVVEDLTPLLVWSCKQPTNLYSRFSCSIITLLT